MLYALNQREEWITAEPRLAGFCPSCNDHLIPKCGPINIWHWAHSTLDDCDPWSDGETEWHLQWKELIKPEFCEVQIGGHRADIVGRHNVVIELQHSSLSVEDIQEREDHYEKLIWIFDLASSYSNIEFRKKDGYFTFRWKWPHKRIGYVTKPTVFDLGTDRPLFELRKFSHIPPAGGWGRFIERKDFIRTVIGKRRLSERGLALYDR